MNKTLLPIDWDINKPRFAVGQLLVPFFAACGDMQEVLEYGQRFCVVRGDKAEAQKVVDALNGADKEQQS